jgi:RHS repeat-associated protein
VPLLRYDGRGQLTDATSAREDSSQGWTYGYTAATSYDASGLGDRTLAAAWGPDGARHESYAMGSDSAVTPVWNQYGTTIGSDDRLRLVHRDEGGAMCRDYDASGNLVSTGFGTAALEVATACGAPLPASCFEHDDWGRVAAAGRTQPDGTCQPYWRYSYDYKGRRVEVAGEGPFAARWYRFVYDQADRLLTEIEMDLDGGDPEHNYYYLAGEPLAMERLGDARAVFYFHNDHLGTPQRLSQADGTVKWAARYSPFGELGPDDVNAAVDCQDPPLENPLRFPGQYDDARKGTGFYYYYNYHRYYDPAVGRYTQVDPPFRPTLEPGIYAPGYTGQAAYGYAGNTPTTATDPSGLFFIYRGCKLGDRLLLEEVIDAMMRYLPSCVGCSNYEKIKRWLDGDTVITCAPNNAEGDCGQGFKYSITLYENAFRRDKCGCLTGTIVHELTHSALGYHSEPQPRKNDACMCRQGLF